MIDLVPLARAGREVTDRQGSAGFIGEPLEFPLPQAQSRPMAAAGVRRHDNLSGGRIQEPPFGTPPPADGRDGKGPGIVIRSDVDKALVAPDVVNTVRKGPGHRGTRKVMAVHRERLRGPSPLPARIRVVAQQFLLLRLQRFPDLTRVCSARVEHPSRGMRTACAHAQEAPVLYLSSLVRARPACRGSSTGVHRSGLPGSAASADASVVASAQS